MDSYKLVIADDHVLLRQGLIGLLKGIADLEVIGEVGDGIELLELLQTLTPHLVIIDISMPKLRGIEAIRAIKKQYPAVKLLVLSMHKEYLHQALTAGADGYLLKEDADRDLFSAIEKIRQGGTYLSPRFPGERQRRVAPPTAPLSTREISVLKLIVQGKLNREIADTLFISVRTVESHRAAILRKLQVKNTADLVTRAIEKGYL